MKDLVALIDRYQPGYASTVEPASSIELEDLEEAAGPLPGAYVRFLKTMGRSVGALRVHDAHFNVAEVLMAYQLAPWVIRDQYLFIAGDRSPANAPYFLDRSAPSGDDDCLVVMMLGHQRERCDVLHVGLEEFLYVEAYRSMRLPRLGPSVGLAPVPLTNDPLATAERAGALAEGLGFKRIGPARRSALYERGDAAMVLYRHPHQEAFSFRLAAAEPPELERLVAAFTEETHVATAPLA